MSRAGFPGEHAAAGDARGELSRRPAVSQAVATLLRRELNGVHAARLFDQLQLVGRHNSQQRHSARQLFGSRVL
jgi:hypothetical protein